MLLILPAPAFSTLLCWRGRLIDVFAIRAVRTLRTLSLLLRWFGGTAQITNLYVLAWTLVITTTLLVAGNGVLIVDLGASIALRLSCCRAALRGSAIRTPSACCESLLDVFYAVGLKSIPTRLIRQYIVARELSNDSRMMRSQCATTYVSGSSFCAVRVWEKRRRAPPSPPAIATLRPVSSFDMSRGSEQLWIVDVLVRRL